MSSANSDAGSDEKITCQICEDKVNPENLVEHSGKCREVTESKECLYKIKAEILSKTEEAYEMRNTISLNAALHKQMYKKSKEEQGSPKEKQQPSPLKKPKLLKKQKSLMVRRDSFSTKKEDDLDNLLSGNEDDPITPLRKQKETNIEVKELSDENYRKVMDEYKQTTYILKQVIEYGSKIQHSAYDINVITDFDLNIRSEIEQLMAEIVDKSVALFLNLILDKINEFISAKQKHIKKTKELEDIDSKGQDPNSSFGSIKSKFKSKKSVSFSKKKTNGLKMRFKEESSNNSSNSPGLKQTGNIKSSPTKKSPKLNSPGQKKNSPKKDYLNSPSKNPTASLQNSIMARLAKQSIFSGSPKTDSTDSPDKARGSVGSGGSDNPKDFSFMMANSNHLNSKTSHHKGGATTSSGKKPLGLGGMDELKQNLKKNSIMNSPYMNGSPARVGRTNFRDTSKKSVFGNVFEKMKTNDGAQSKNNMDEIQLGGTGEKKKHKRTNSVDFLKTLHTSEPKSTTFPSLSNLGGESTPQTKEESKDDPREDKSILQKKFAFQDDILDSPDYIRKSPKKKKRQVEVWESPQMDGYHSDPNSKNTKPMSANMDSDNSEEITVNDFEFLKMIGKGAYGKVWLVKRKATGDLFAMKIVEYGDKQTRNKIAALKAEQGIFKVLKGDFVVKAFFTFEHENYVCFVMEYMLGGDFGSILEKVGCLEEQVAKFYFAELVLALESLHQLNIIHRDLKPENILLDKEGHIKLTDFGLSEQQIQQIRKGNTPMLNSQSQTLDEQIRKKTFDKYVKSPEKNAVEFKITQQTMNQNTEDIFNLLPLKKEIKTNDDEKFKKQNKKVEKGNADKKHRIIGTPDYMAPEIVNGEGCSEKTVDWWSMGVILYEFICGIPPFNDETVDKIFENINARVIEWPPIGEEDGISVEAADLIDKLLTADPKKRLGINGTYEIKDHAFFKDFDWNEFQNRPAPIIPFVSDPADISNFEKSKPLSEEEKLNPFNSEPTKNRSQSGSMLKPGSFNFGGAFKMRRLDLLDDQNKKNAKKFMNRQKTVNLGKIENTNH